MLLNFVKSLTRTQKRTTMMWLDAALVPLAMAIAFALGKAGPVSAGMSDVAVVLPYLILAAAGLSRWSGISSIQLNAFDGFSVGMTALCAFVLSALSGGLAAFAGIDVSAGTHMIFGACYFALCTVTRAVMLQVVTAIYRYSAPTCRVLIYGAGTTGLQLERALRAHDSIYPVAFVDDNAALQGSFVSGLPVYTPLRIAEIVREKKIDRVLLAIPSLSPPKQAQIARRLQKMGLDVQALPSFAQLVGEEALIQQLQDVKPKRFLNRAEVSAPLREVAGCYSGRVVLISGAGGSIGSELSRQVLECAPSKLILFELNELALYSVEQELQQIREGGKVEIVPILGSVTDPRHVRQVLAAHQVDIVLHAAAYKHVPLVESNPLAGLANNVLGTQTLAREAAEAGVDRVILVSTDKAVRPTNVMGASKRLAEMVVQDLASRVPRGSGPVYTMVRFGNVLGSSGSVVPLFREQIRRGGPVTVTHPDVKRYFMTVQEAVSLVLTAGAMAEGGEVFVLDMGKPVRILQLARQVIESAGYSVRDSDNPDGDIEIEITRLRPGEKLTEELTISGELTASRHPKIFTTRENSLSELEVASFLSGLRHAVEAGDESAALAVLCRWVEGYTEPKRDRKTS